MELSKFPKWLVAVMSIINFGFAVAVLILCLNYKDRNDVNASFKPFSINEMNNENLKENENSAKEKMILKINTDYSSDNKEDEDEYELLKNKEIYMHPKTEKKLRNLYLATNYLSTEIIFFFNIFVFYLSLILFISAIGNDQGKVCGGLWGTDYDLNKDSILTIIINICCLYIFLGILYGATKCFGRYGARYFALIAITISDFIIFIITLSGTNTDIGQAKAIYILEIIIVFINIATTISINTCIKFSGDDDVSNQEATATFKYTSENVSFSTSPISFTQPTSNTPSVYVEAEAPLITAQPYHPPPPHYAPPPHHPPPHYSPPPHHPPLPHHAPPPHHPPHYAPLPHHSPVVIGVQPHHSPVAIGAQPHHSPVVIGAQPHHRPHH